MTFNIHDDRHQWAWAIGLAKQGEPMELIKTLRSDLELDADSRNLLAEFVAATRQPLRAGRPAAMTDAQKQEAVKMFYALTTDGPGYRKVLKGVAIQSIAERFGVSPSAIEQLIRVCLKDLAAKVSVKTKAEVKPADMDRRLRERYRRLGRSG